jgi:hypothetical protein
MRMNHFLVTFILFILVSVSNSQTTFTEPVIKKKFPKLDISKLKSKSVEQSKSYWEKKRMADSVATVMGFPIRFKTKDGGLCELQYFENGCPIYYSSNNAVAAATISTNKIWSGSGGIHNLTGFGILLGIWDEGMVRTTHDEFGGRVLPGPGESGNTAKHSTHVAGTMIAFGQVANARGMADMASLYSYDWNNDLGEMENANPHMQISNHSYGTTCGWFWNEEGEYWQWYGKVTLNENEDYEFGYYSDLSHELDDFVYMLNPYHLPIISAGNDRGEIMTEMNNHPYDPNTDEHWYFDEFADDWMPIIKFRPPDGNSGFDCIPGGLATAKNVLTVGNVFDIPNGYSNPGSVILFPSSSCGPTDDGRIKPDLVANGFDLYSTIDNSDNSYDVMTGTSMAAPSVSGSIALILEHYENLFPEREAMLASTIKALLIHTTDHAGDNNNDGPNYIYGWGLMNTKKAVNVLDLESEQGNGGHMGVYQLTNSTNVELSIQSTGTEPLIVTICWTDPPAEPPSLPSLDPTDIRLINDLDLKLENTQYAYYFPYVLDPANPSAPASTGDNDRDNVEKIIIPPTTSQLYTATITHEGTIANDAQTFSIIVSGGNITEAEIPEPPPSGWVYYYFHQWKLTDEPNKETGSVYWWNEYGENKYTTDAPHIIKIEDWYWGPCYWGADLNVYCNQKFQSMNNAHPRAIKQFILGSGQNKHNYSYLQPIGNARIGCANLDGSDLVDATIFFKDPWFVDPSKSLYNNNILPNSPDLPRINLGNNAIWEELPLPGPAELLISSSRKGVLLNQRIDIEPASYFIKADPIKNCNIHGQLTNFYFQNWDATDAEINNSLSTETAITFLNDGAVAQARYKGHGVSTTARATGYNNGRRIASYNGIIYLVYEDNNEIWFTYTTNNGATWQSEIRISEISDSETIYKNPSIAVSNVGDNILHLVYEKQYYHYILQTWVTEVLYRRMENNMWGNPQIITSENDFHYGDARPVIAADLNDYAILVAAWYLKQESQTNKKIYARYCYQGEWQNITEVPGNVHFYPALEIMHSTVPGQTNLVKMLWTSGSTGHLIKYISGVLAQGGPIQWSSIYTLNPNPGYELNSEPSLSIDDNNYGYITYHGSWYNGSTGVNEIWYNKYNFNNTPPTMVGSYTQIAGSNCQLPVISVTSSGTPITIFYMNNNNIYRKKYQNGSWTSTNFSDGKYPSLTNHSTSGAVWTRYISAPYILKTDLGDGGFHKVITGPEEYECTVAKRFIYRISKPDSDYIILDLDNTFVNGKNYRFNENLETESLTLSGDNKITLHWQIDDMNLKGDLSLLHVYFKTSAHKYLMESVSTSKIIAAAEDSGKIIATSLNFNSKEIMTGQLVIEFKENIPFVFDVVKDNTEANTLVKNISGDTEVSYIIPAEFRLGQNFPNPFNPVTQISYDLPKSGNVSLKVYNTNGQQVSVLVNAYEKAGRYQVIFDGSHLASGIYFYQLEAGRYTDQVI